MNATPPNPFRRGLAEIEYRERLLTGLWYDDLWAELVRQLGQDRANLVGTPDLSRNPLARLSNQLAVLYSPPPLITGLPPELTSAIGDWSGPVLAESYTKAKGSPMPSKLAEVQAQALLFALACNECGVMFPWAKKAKRVIPSLAMPSNLRGLEDPQNPGQPSALAWRRKAMIESKDALVWDVWDVRGTPTYYVSSIGAVDDEAFFEDAPKHQVLKSEARKGYAYPWRDLDEEPIIPGSILHRRPHAGLWDRSSGGELAQATVTLAVLLTHWGHGLKDGCWVRPYVLGAQLVTGQQTPTTPGTLTPNSVPNDLSSLMEFEADPKARQVMIGQLNPAWDPEVILKAILAWEQALWSQILSIDVSSTGGDPLASIAAAREVQIRSQYPANREHDARCLQVAAVVARRFGGIRVSRFEPGILYREEIQAAMPAPTPTPEPPTDDTPDSEESDG